MVFPARAGMIPRIVRPCCSVMSIPRESGDDPRCRNGTEIVAGYSPRERG